MKTSLNSKELSTYLAEQLNGGFPDGNKVNAHALSPFVISALERLEYSLSFINKPRIKKDGQIYFNHLYSDNYAMFLYLVSRILYEENGRCDLADKLYYLNKSMHAIDVFYEVQMPSIFQFCHCVGTVLGRAIYKDYFVVTQNCTVGNNRGIYPVLGEKVALHAGATLIGSCTIGDDVHIATHAVVRDADVPSRSVVAGASPNLIIKPAHRSTMEIFYSS